MKDKKGTCETCGAKDVTIFCLRHYGLVCRYCKATYLTKIDTNDRANIALMFNALERTMLKKTIITILLCLMLGGCEIKSLHERVWDSEKNLIKKIDVTVASCLMSTKARNIIAVTSDKLLFVGDFSQVPDPASVKAVFSAVAEAWWPWWKGVKP